MSIDGWVIELRREFHRQPEASWQEHRTAARVEEVLATLGIATQRLAGTGVVGTIQGAGSGPVVALRADMDALQQNEKTGLPYASQTAGLMHACGHDAHTAALLGAARLLVQERASWSGQVRLLFQPAEELAGGAKAMMAAGALDGVEAVFGAHVFGTLPVGKVALTAGPVLAGGDRFKVLFRGKGGHAAMPHLAVDALAPACQALLGLQTIITREFDAKDRLVITVGQLHGGTRFNVVADEAWFDGTARYFRPESAVEVEQKLRRVAVAAAAAHRAEAEVEYDVLVPPTVNDPSLTRMAVQVAAGLWGDGAVVAMEPVMGSEDFSFMSARVPGVFAGIGAGNAARGVVYPNHHPQFDIDEDCLAVMTRMYAGFARAFLAAR